MSKPDFCEEAHRLITNAVSTFDRERDVRLSLERAFAAGLEHAAEIALESNLTVGGVRLGIGISAAIRAEKEKTNE